MPPCDHQLFGTIDFDLRISVVCGRIITAASASPRGHLCGVFAEFERCMIRGRVNSGLARAKANGVEMGRGKRKDGTRSTDEVRWGVSTAEMEKRTVTKARAY